MTTNSSQNLSDRALLEATERAAGDERRSTAELVALLAEVDARRLYLGEGYSSLFAYCTGALHLSEHAAYHRIEAARASRLFPGILEFLTEGAITLTTVALLRPHLTWKNHRALLEAARHKSRREVEQQIANLAPRPDVPSLIRRVPQDDSTAGTALLPVASDVPRPKVEPLASDRYLLRITLSSEAHAKLREAQALMRHLLPTGDPAAIIDRALALLVDQLKRSKAADVKRPRTAPATDSRPPGASRHVPADVRRQVWVRDEGRCAFVGARGRCTETGCLEFHHVIPFARGGPAIVENIALRCRAHNGHEAELWFGSST